jgi:hypothetical protein
MLLTGGVSMRCWLCLLFAGVAATLVWVWPESSFAAPRRGRTVVAKVTRAKAAARARGRVRARAARRRAGVAAEPAPAVPAAVASGPVVNDGGVKAKVYNFNALDIDGKLRGPQLLYFLNRIKTELDASSLERRSFLPELERTASDPNL